MRYREVLTYPIAVRRDATQPLREQIAEQIAAAVDGGAAPRGARVPSTRTMAELLGVSRGVVGEAYDLLHARGYLVTRPGSGTFISGGTAPPQAVRAGRSAGACAPQWTVDFTPGQLCGEAFPIRAWRAAWRYASHQVPAPTAAPALGLPVLRRAITDHLAQTRGIIAPDHEVVVTAGTAAGLRLVLEALGGPVAMERPVSPDLLRAAPEAAVLPDAFADLPDGVRVAVACPDGNRPLGTVMPEARRKEALAWSMAGGWLVEVARDAIFLPHIAGLPRLQPSPRVVTVGGFGEVLAPSLKLGYALVPRELAGAVADLVADRAEQPPDLTQLAVARLLADGTMVRQMRRLTRLYEAKRGIVAAILQTRASDPQAPAICRANDAVNGPRHVDCQANSGILVGEAGTALLGFGDPAAPEILHRNGIRMPTLDAYGKPDQTFVLGFGHLPDKALRESLSHLVSSLGRSTQKEKQ
jgi:GntR family transcriptional regulator / MocR family aminotransferase